MFFADDGFLYLSIGDQFRYTTAQRIDDNFEGGVIRIDVDEQGGGVSHPPRRRMGVDTGHSDETSGNHYYIPDDNPFLDPGGGLFEEFWTVGHRNPHRMTLDRPAGRIWSGEIGASSREEVNVIQGGRNYQWPYKEGLQNHSYPKPDPILGTDQPPVIDFTRSEANAIIGGHVYRGSKNPDLVGKYVCGDYIKNTIWALTLDPSGQSATKQQLLTYTQGLLCTFGIDQAGEVFACGLGNNVPIYRLDRQNGYPEAPTLLSETGAFADVGALSPAQGLIPYGVTTELWSDGTHKLRWMAIPNDGVPNSPAEMIGFAEDGEWTFPEGTVLVKHFETPEGRRLETRLLVNGETGWYGVTYRWNMAQTDATLLTSSYLENVTINGQQVSYYYPSREDCLLCHNVPSGSVNGIKTRQLNSDFTYPKTGSTANQLVTLDHLGFLSPPLDASLLPAYVTSVPKDDLGAPLELRIRSYLDANCAQCHRPGQGHSSIDARLTRAMPFQGILDGTLSDPLGIPGARVVKPGDLSKSMLYLRANSLGGCCAMPPLGKGVIDAEFVDMLEEWITGMEPAATGGSVAQSSTKYGAGPERAVDARIDGTLANASVTHTQRDFEAHWEADLGTEYYLDGLRLWNRTDCCSDRLSDFYVLASSSPFASSSLGAVLAQPGVTWKHFPGIATRTELFGFQREARYVRIQLRASDPLSLAEVQPLAYTAGAGPKPVTYCTAKTNSCGDVPAIGWAGLSSATASNGFVLSATHAKPNRPGLVLYSQAGPRMPAAPFGFSKSGLFHGYLCIESVARSTQVLSPAGVPGSCDSTFSLDMNAFAQGMAGGSPQAFLSVPGIRVDAQWWGRDTFKQGNFLTDAIAFEIGP